MREAPGSSCRDSGAEVAGGKGVLGRGATAYSKWQLREKKRGLWGAIMQGSRGGGVKDINRVRGNPKKNGWTATARGNRGLGGRGVSHLEGGWR